MEPWAVAWRDQGAAAVSAVGPTELRRGDLRLCLLERTARVGEAGEARLTGRQFRFLLALMRAPATVTDAELRAAMRSRGGAHCNLVAVYASTLRRALRAAGLPGDPVERLGELGYRLSPRSLGEDRLRGAVVRGGGAKG